MQDANPDGYVLSRTKSEYARLLAQSETWAPFTVRVLESAGLGTGMTALDAGCGPCDVMRLMGRLVGPSGSVTGVDIDPEVARYGLERLREDTKGNFHFHAANLLDGGTVPGAPFDIVFCRFLLIHIDDPVEMVRRLAALTKPGGTLVAMDYVLAAAMVAPHDPVLERGYELLKATFAVSGRALDAGIRLPGWFRSAGLPMPHGLDVQGFIQITDGDLMLANTLAGLAPQAVRLGLATEDEIAALPGQIRAVAARGENCAHLPTVCAAWTCVGG